LTNTHTHFTFLLGRALIDSLGDVAEVITGLVALIFQNLLRSILGEVNSPSAKGKEVGSVRNGEKVETKERKKGRERRRKTRKENRQTKQTRKKNDRKAKQTQRKW
jgi:hypothetical protein